MNGLETTHADASEELVTHGIEFLSLVTGDREINEEILARLQLRCEDQADI